MTRDEMLAKIQAIASRPGYPAHCGYQGDAIRLVDLLPERAFEPIENGEVTVIEDGDGCEPPQPLTGEICLSWYRTKPHSYLTASLTFKTSGYSGFEISIQSLHGVSPDIAWQDGFGPNVLFASETARPTLDSLFDAFFAEP